MLYKWCPYLGKEISETAFNKEHIIPLSLGGNNQFTIDVEKEKNAQLGSRLDAKIANSPIISSARRYYSLKGQNKKKPTVIWPIEHQSLKGQLNLTPETPVFSTFRSHNGYGLNIKKNLSGGERLKTSFPFDENILLSFGAKIALGTGYYLYRDVFRKYGHHDVLRELMNSENPSDRLRFLVSMNKGLGFWGLSWPKTINTSSVFPPWCDALLSQTDKNVIFTLHSNSELIMGFSILSGFYKWYFNLSNATNEFSTGGEFELGVAIEIDLIKKSFLRTGLRSYLHNFLEKLNN